MIANIAAAYISMHFGFKGENFCPVSACATGNHSIGEAMRAIRHGYQDVVVCGGTENGIIPISMAGFQNMKAVHMGEDPTAASIPFDARRSGFVMGEGAGCLVLESLTHAQQRGATILRGGRRLRRVRRRIPHHQPFSGRRSGGARHPRRDRGRGPDPG